MLNTKTETKMGKGNLEKAVKICEIEEGIEGTEAEEKNTNQIFISIASTEKFQSLLCDNFLC